MTDGEIRNRPIRAFVAVHLPADGRAAVAGVQQRLRCSSEVKWVEPENFHFTLRFLGESDPQALRALEHSLGVLLEGQTPFSLSLMGVNAFPSLERPRTIWVGVGAGKERLEELARLVERGAVGCGFLPEERPFRSHLTIGRVKAVSGLAPLVERLRREKHIGEIARVHVGEVVLMQSELQRSGPRYTPLARFPLQAAAE